MCQSIFSGCSINECKFLFSLLHVGWQVIGCIIQMDKCSINDGYAFEDVLQTFAEIVAVPQACKSVSVYSMNWKHSRIK